MTGTAALLMTVLLVSGCASHRVAPTGPTGAEIEERTCVDFARGEVRRLGESVPGALVTGLLGGIMLDITRLIDPQSLPPGIPDLPPVAQLLPWTLWSAPQLVRDAERTNADVYEQAIRTCWEPVRLAEAFGPDDARVAMSLEVLATCYVWQGKHAQAEPLRRRSVAIWETVFGPDYIRVARALHEHANVLRHLHREAEAERLEARAATIGTQRDAHAPAPAVTHPRPIPPSCDSSSSAAIFVLCRHATGAELAGAP